MESLSLTSMFYWYWYLISRRTLDFLNFILVIFIFPILPYAIVAYNLMKETEAHQKAFYGDGSLMILCSGILCSFVAMLFEHKNDTEKKLNLFINLILIILFIVITIVFMDAQMNFSRDWAYINRIITITSFILIVTVLASLYLNFRLKINYSDVESFIEEVKRKRIEKKAAKSNKSKGGTRV